MCKIHWMKDSIATWLVLTDIDSVDKTDAVRRLKQLDRRFDKLLEDYTKVRDNLKEDHTNARQLYLDSKSGSN